MEKIRINKIGLFFIVFCLSLAACAQNNNSGKEDLIPVPSSDYYLEEVTDREEASVQDRGLQDSPEESYEEMQGNILGYTLIRTSGKVSYVRDADYLIDENSIGNGIFVSEHMAETEAFLGQILIEVVENRGEIAEEKKSYFTDWAVHQLNETQWLLLDKKWTPDKYAYDRFYTISSLWGNTGYEFTYTIYADDTSIMKSKAQVVQLKCVIDCNGIISGINVDISTADKTHLGILCTENTTGLFRDEYREPVIEMGIELAHGDTLSIAQRFGDIAIMALENTCADMTEYKEMFANETAYQAFENHQWGQLETDWRANRYYDCYRTDRGFLYYIYPDYEEMNVEVAKAVTVRFYLDTENGQVTDTEFLAVSMKRDQYQMAKEYLGERSLVVKNGEIQGNGNAKIPIPSKALTSIPLKKYKFGNTPSELLGETHEKPIFVDENLQPYLFGKKLWNELAENSETLGIAGAGEDWQIREGYDSYYYPHNQCAGSNHYCYYFTYRGQGKGEEKVLRIDTWVSQNEVVEVVHNWFMERILSDQAVAASTEETVGKMDITAFLAYDWTADSVLWEHSLQPNDSARGWEFSIADIDFDGILEMLVTFPSNHCGQNCLYIYKQNKGRVYHFADTIACFEKYVVFGTDYKKLSPYLDIILLNAYVGENDVHKYLSLDSSSFGGDSKGGIYTLYLYETSFENSVESKELVRIEEDWPEEKRELYFLGERVYELGALRELLAEYMDGYKKQEICYKTAENMFPRDIVAWSNEEKHQELVVLYDALEELVNE